MGMTTSRSSMSRGSGLSLFPNFPKSPAISRGRILSGGGYAWRDCRHFRQQGGSLLKVQLQPLQGAMERPLSRSGSYQCLAPSFRFIAVPKSYNSQVGVPLSVLDDWDDHQWGFIEAGISHPGEMETTGKDHLPRIWDCLPTWGLLTRRILKAWRRN